MVIVNYVMIGRSTSEGESRETATRLGVAAAFAAAAVAGSASLAVDSAPLPP